MNVAMVFVKSLGTTLCRISLSHPGQRDLLDIGMHIRIEGFISSLDEGPRNASRFRELFDD